MAGTICVCCPRQRTATTSIIAERTKKAANFRPLNVFVQRDGKIHHFYHSELLFAPREPGQDGPARGYDSGHYGIFSITRPKAAAKNGIPSFPTADPP